MVRTLKLLSALAFLAVLGAAQVVNIQIAYVTVAPTGACNAINLALLTPNGTFYTCQAGTWAQISSGGGPPTGAAGGVLSGTYPNPGLSASATAIPNGWTATTQAGGDASQDLATNQFVASAFQFLTPYGSVQAATTGALPNTPTYANGSAGVGATLTAGSNGALTVDGYVVLLNDRILVKNQASALQNGVYTQTTLGTGGVPYVLTRSTDYNTLQNINFTGDIQLLFGSTQGGQNWYLNSLITSIGTSALNYSQDTTNVNSSNGGVKATGTLINGDVILGGGNKNIKDAGYAPATCSAPQFLQALNTCVTPVLTENSQSAAYTTVLADAGKMILHPSTDNNARTFTIDSNANVAYPIGTCITFVNMINTVTIAITSDTMTLMGSNTTGSRTMAVGNWATACKIASTSWVIGGSSGLT